MKKIIIMGVLGAILAGCGDRDEEYFFKNQDKAKTVLKSCEEKLLNALENGNEKEFKALEADAECRAANSALKKQRQLDWEKERAEEELKKKLAQEARLKEIADEKAKIVAANSNNSWEKNVSEYLKQDCNVPLWGEPTVACAAWIEFYDEAVAKGKAELAAFSFDDLKDKSKEFCALDQRRGSTCAIWQDALADKGVEELKGADIYVLEARRDEFCAQDISNLAVCNQSWRKAWDAKNEELVKYFTDNDAEFVQTYNQCVEQLDEIRDQKLGYFKMEEASRLITRKAPCQQAADAYSRRGMGYSPFKVKIAE